jgi:hypothetical protein
MMGFTEAYLLMNPNLKPAVLAELIGSHRAAKVAAWKRLEELTKNMDAQQAIEVYGAVLPVLLSW